MLIDYHVHSTCSGDCPVPMRDMCAQAVALGITDIAFTEHFDNDPRDMCCGTFDLDFYRSEIEAARNEFGDSLRIFTGIEFGEPYLYPDLIREVATWDLDVILASMHWIGDIILAIDGPELAKMDAGSVYDAYFDETLKCVERGGFDVMAHFDIAKRYIVKYAGPFDFPRYRDRIAGILEAMIRKGIALEVNTSGLRQPCQETMPGLDTLKLYHDLGGELVTIGTDSHRTTQLGFGLAEGMDLIRRAGFKAITTYSKRQPGFTDIE